MTGNPGNEGPARRRYAERLPVPERREQLMDVAMRIITESGYSAVSVNSVARGANVTRPVVYDCFASSDDLLTALVERQDGRLLAAMWELVPTGLPADADLGELVVAVAERFLQSVHDSPDTWRLALLPDDGLPQPLRDKIGETRDGLEALVERLIDVRRQEGVLPETLDSAVLARMLLDVGETFASMVIAEPARHSPGRLAAALTAMSRLVRPVP